MPTDSGESECPPTTPPVVADAVQPNELVLRRVLNQPKQYDTRREIPLQEGAFLPGKHDTTGLSLSRRQSTAHPDFLTPEMLKERCRAHRPETSGVVQLVAGQVHAIGLLVNPDPIVEDVAAGVLADPGHALLPAINSNDFQTDQGRAQIRVWAAQLVDLVMQDRATSVVIKPG